MNHSLRINFEIFILKQLFCLFEHSECLFYEIDMRSHIIDHRHYLDIFQIIDINIHCHRCIYFLRNDKGLAPEVTRLVLLRYYIKRKQCHKRVRAKLICDIVYLHFNLSLSAKYEYQMIATQGTHKYIRSIEIAQQYLIVLNICKQIVCTVHIIQFWNKNSSKMR